MTLTIMDGYYLGNTCLTLEMAYLNARLLARPVAPWLADFEGENYADGRTPETEMFLQLENCHIAETFELLSKAQKRRLLMVAQGLSLREIAIRLAIFTLMLGSAIPRRFTVPSGALCLWQRESRGREKSNANAKGKHLDRF